MKPEYFSESIEMYLKTVSELAPRHDPVPISALAERMGVSSVSATEMVHRLEDQGLLRHVPYKGVSLTTGGWEKATEVVRSHRLWECFLSDCLRLPWDAVHDIACRLEHATDPLVTDALDDYLGHPAVCPHGNPIPGGDIRSQEGSDRPLSGLLPGQSAVVARIYPETNALLTYLTGLGLLPGAQVTLRQVAPFGGPMVLDLAGGPSCYLGQEAAAHVFVSLEHAS